MSNDQRRIGFAASSHPRAVSIPENFDFLRPTVPSKSFTTSNSSSLAFASSELLRFDSSLATFRPEPHLPLGFWPSSRLHPCAATSSRRLPAAASFRHQVFSTSRRLSPHSGSQAYSIPLPRPGFLTVQGLLSPRSHPSSSEGASPRPLLPRLAHRLSPAATRRGPRLRGLHLREAAFATVPLFTVLHAAPLLGFRSSRHLTSFGWTRLTHVLRSRRFFGPAFASRLSPSRSQCDLVLSVSPDRSPASRLRFACLLELSSLSSNPPCPLHQLTARCLAMIWFGSFVPRPLGCPRVRFPFSRSSCSSVARRAPRVSFDASSCSIRSR
jgi:hypothetical protein